MRLFLLLTSMIALLTGCDARTNSTSNANTATSQAVHQQWVAALRDARRDDALAAAAPQQLQQAFVDENLNRVQSIIRTQTDGRRAYGVFQRVDRLSVNQNGAQATGMSTWHFAQLTVCYETMLTNTAGRWGVTQWGQRATCPPGGTP